MKALIVDGDPYIRVRLGVFLRERPGIEVVGECEGGFEAVEAFVKTHPEFVQDTDRERLLLSAYRQGVFPWYDEESPVLWWSPDPRFILQVKLGIARDTG